ncbi:ROK family transcriptional regulator [Evansella cellulosilytica]|uniref:ROK family protein n=1 Tax=Evansella cellulosilytica (strain ATCC 21833 / DSM 2522 / FERM P-1141 / JCM 9156 / N-4) TaxID=649639 RepID=E6TQC9_EVAC2|nr:ROK family transcriptional regulator [Evansella cellulosilytica]ADU29307.1 ROK family protein [Evansella cellulosilytica DSM 2522]
MSFIPQTGSFEGMKSLNKSAILNVIRFQGPISRADIAKTTKLTPPTVGSIVSELLQANLLVEEAGEGKSQGGRKPIMLSVNSSAFYAIGVYAAAEVIHTVIATLDGEITYSFEQKVSVLPSKDAFLKMIVNGIKQVMKHRRIKRESIIGIGVGMHGLVDPEKGISIFAPHLHLENILIKSEIEAEFSIPVLVDNDVRTLALAESWYGQGANNQNFICVSVGLGIGSSIVLNGDIYNGPYHSAGELGHTLVDVNGPRCSCGNYGCLEAFASEGAILNRLKKGIRLGRNWNYGDADKLTIESVIQAAQDKDPFALEVLEETGRYLGIAIANIINILTPSKVILEGRIFEIGDVIIEPLRQIVQRSTLRNLPGEVSIVTSDLGKKGMVMGAYTLILRKMFINGGVG